MRYIERTIPGLMLLGAIVAAGQAGNAPRQRPKANSQARQTASEDRGQQVFNQNCSRCHNAPEGFPASVSGTIARHMRVRAGLSQDDYKALLKFLHS